MRINVLIVSVCKERLHELEFVKPIGDILRKKNISYFRRSYKEIKKEDLVKASHIILCGTSLRDNEYLENSDCFSWILDLEKPLLGICAGMQIIGLVFGGKIKKKIETGYFREEFKKDFLGMKGIQEVYHLHKYSVDFSKLDGFEIFNKGKVAQAVKFGGRGIYGVLFHPEVRQKNLILEFIRK